MDEQLIMFGKQLERLTEIVQRSMQIGETATQISHSASILNIDRRILLNLRTKKIKVGNSNQRGNQTSNPIPKIEILTFDRQNPKT